MSDSSSASGSRPDVSGVERPLALGIMHPGDRWAKWEIASIAALAESGLARPVVLLRERRPRTHHPHRRLERSWRAWAVRRSRALRRVEPQALPEFIARLPRVTFRIDSDDLGPPSARDADLREVNGHNLDIIVRFGAGGLGADVLSAATHGVWSFRHGTEEPDEFGPRCLAEFASGAAVVEARLCRLSPDGSGERVLVGGAFPVQQHSYVATLDLVCEGTTGWLTRACRPLSLGQSGAPRRAAPPSGWRAVRVRSLLARQVRSAVRRLVKKLLYVDVWNVGVVSASIEQVLKTGRAQPVRWLPAPPAGHFYADPFAVRRDGCLHILVEEFDHRQGKGWISATSIGDDGTVAAFRPVLRRPVHLSYPYLLEWDGELWCVPEMAQSGAVQAFHSQRLPWHWRPLGTVAGDLDLVDPTLFRHGGRWWLLGTRAATGVNLSLHAWFADSPRGPWSPHALNPIKVDVRSSRPAGPPFVVDGVLYRPAQDCSRTYGGGVVFNRVLTLTPTAFAEEPVTLVRPDATGPYGEGLHTICPVGDAVVIDGKQTRLWARKPLYRLRDRIAREAASR